MDWLLKFWLTITPTGEHPLPSPEVLPSYQNAFLKMALTFIAIIVGLIGTIWALRRLAGGRLGGSNGQLIKIIERKPLSPKTILYIVEVKGQKTLIAESQLEVKKLVTLDKSPLDEENSE